MKICIVATHSFPIPMPGLHTGDVVILDLSHGLRHLGHDVTVCAPEGTDWEPLLPMPASYGSYPPSSQQCELDAFAGHAERLGGFDIVHDFSVSKMITRRLNETGYTSTIATLMGGPWRQDWAPRNLVVWSQSHRERVLRGATDFEGTPHPDMGGRPGYPVSDAHVVHGGIDTTFYCPGEHAKEDYDLWLGRWHPARGYEVAIAAAKLTGRSLVMAGEHPDNERFRNQRECAIHAVSLADGCRNIRFQWLPKDPHHHTAKRELYRKARTYLYPVEFHEPFGLSQVEAMACGTPVVGTPYGSVPEVSTVNQAECRQRAVEMFDRVVMARNYVSEYERVLSGESW